MTKRTWKHLNEHDYKTAKTLQDAGLSISKTAEVTGRAWGTIGFIYKSKDMAEYHHLIATVKNGSRLKDKVEEPTTTAPLPTNLNRDANELLLELHRQNVAIQERQAVALESLVVAWNSSPAKKKLF